MIEFKRSRTMFFELVNFCDRIFRDRSLQLGTFVFFEKIKRIAVSSREKYLRDIKVKSKVKDKLFEAISLE